MVGTTVYYLHEDALGSTRLVATASVTVTFSSNYVPYGSNYAISGKEVFMYTGKAYDTATGLYYYGARYYDPGVGRFVTEDSYTGDLNDPLSLNLYIYARDNPERYVDPTGHMILLSAMMIDGMIARPYVVQPATPVAVVESTSSVSDTERKRNEYVYTKMEKIGVTAFGGYTDTELTRNEWTSPAIGITGRGPTSESLRTTTPSNSMNSICIVPPGYTQPAGPIPGFGVDAIPLGGDLGPYVAGGLLAVQLYNTIIAPPLKLPMIPNPYSPDHSPGCDYPSSFGPVLTMYPVFP